MLLCATVLLSIEAWLALILPGFMADISKCRAAAELPAAALSYVRYIEEAVGCRISYVSVGAGRDDYFELG